jgi:hypothetical protein
MLHQVRNFRVALDGKAPEIDDLITNARVRLEPLEQKLGRRIEPRRKPKLGRWDEVKLGPRREYLVFLDECGGHEIRSGSDADFPAFALTAAIVDSEHYVAFDNEWRRWKAKWLGSQDKIIHEPNVRRRNGPFWSEGSRQRQESCAAALSEQISSLDFALVGAVIDKQQYLATFGEATVDEFLPYGHYLMCLDFVLERVLHFLFYQGQDAMGIAIAESRGSKEDAELQREYVRLHLEGTLWQPDSWFRHQMSPTIEFREKSSNQTGLQVADLAARPCAEKVLAPGSEPERWSVFKAKLYEGGQRRPESYGLKVFPWKEEHEKVFE